MRPPIRKKPQSNLFGEFFPDGLYFTTQATHYYVGMHLNVTLGYSPNDPCNRQSFGEVVRTDRLEDGRFGIAVKIHMR